MEKRNKRRVAHLGEHASKKKKNMVDDDFDVTNMVKEMDINLFDPRNKKLKEILRSRAAEKVISRSNSCSTPVIQNQQNMTSVQKKILRSKHHPLMAKVQKNINYIKHNRKMPKPRAHIGGIRQMNENKIIVNDSMQSSSSVLKTIRSTYVTGKNRLSLSNSPSNTNSDESGSDASSESIELPNLSSDSESEYEYFIQSQKQEMNEEKMDKRAKGKKKIRSNKNELKKIKASSKKKKCNQGDRRKLHKLESSDDEDETLNKKITIHKNSKISSKITNANRLMLPPTSDESSAASSNENELLKTESFIPSVEKENNEVPVLKTTESFIPSVENENKVEVPERLNTNINCIVRIERNPSLEETVSRLHEFDVLQKGEKNLDDECLSKLQNQELKGVESSEDEIIPISDDECMFVCEVPKSSTANTCVPETSDSASSIQILDVKSLKECEKENETYFEGTNRKISNVSCDDNEGSGINFEKLKEAIEIARMQENHKNYNDMRKENVLSIPADTIKAINSIDLNQFLSRSDNQSKVKSSSITDVNMFNSLPCSSTSIDEQPSIKRLPSSKTENTPENHGGNLEKSLTAKQSLAEGQSRTLNSLQSENDTNSYSGLLTHSYSPIQPINLDLNTSTLKKILSNAERLAAQSEGNAFQDREFNTYQLKTKFYESPSDELDVLTTERIQEMCHYQTSQNHLKLYNLFSRTSHEYIGNNNHENITPGLKMLQEIEANRKRQTRIVYEHVIKHDPCFYSTIVEQAGRSSNTNIIQIPANEGNVASQQIKMCANCGSKASILCTWCMKVSYCTEECGISYWENKHCRECSGLNNEEKMNT